MTSVEFQNGNVVSRFISKTSLIALLSVGYAGLAFAKRLPGL